VIGMLRVGLGVQVDAAAGIFRFRGRP